ncbi:Vacuolar protein sorting-associated protein 29 [Diplonema papillatum]|nr:Vacuolar protein sorting-associated protein 29 [Diplonema papillatum]
MLILVVGDVFIPSRRLAVPEAFSKLLKKDVFDHCLCTGNTGDEAAEYVRSLAKKTTMIEGGFADAADATARWAGVQVGDLSVDVTDEIDYDAVMQRRHDHPSEIVVHKSAEHVCTAFTKKGTLYVCPGSLTGAFSLVEPAATPSFVVLDVQGYEVEVFKYSLVDDSVVVHSKFYKLSPARS